MAAFCTCCGAEISLKAEACPVCGTPQHGMLPPDLLPTLDIAGGAAAWIEINLKFRDCTGGQSGRNQSHEKIVCFVEVT